MKKFFILLLSLIFLNQILPVFADDTDFWDEPLKVDQAAKNQEKAVTNQEFEKVMKFFERKKKKQEEKNRPKGAPIGPQIQEGAALPDANSFKVTYESYPTVMIPVTLLTPNLTEIPPGYYRILSVKNGADYYLNFYQGSSLIAKVPAINTGNDHNQKSINYAKVIPVDNDRYMNVIYGDIDCNIEAQLDIKQ